MTTFTNPKNNDHIAFSDENRKLSIAGEIPIKSHPIIIHSLDDFTMKTSMSMYFCNPHSTPLNYQFCWVQCKKLRVRNTFGSFCVAGARDCAPCQKGAKSEGFVAFPKTMAGVEHLKRIFKDAFRVAGAVQETCSSEMLGGQGADFLRGVAF